MRALQRPTVRRIVLSSFLPTIALVGACGKIEDDRIAKTTQREVFACNPDHPSSGPHADACTVTKTLLDEGTPDERTEYRIDQPIVDQSSTEYPGITFQAGDVVTLRAGGCVQRQGFLQDSWNRLVDPTAAKPVICPAATVGLSPGLPSCIDRSTIASCKEAPYLCQSIVVQPSDLYFGTISVPGAYYVTGSNAVVPLQAGNAIPLNKLLDATNNPRSTFQVADVPNLATTRHLTLGYVDDDYSDNGYYDHDDGPLGQCLLENDGGPAYVVVTVKHGMPEPLPVGNVRDFDLVSTDWDENGLFLNPRWGWQVGPATGGTQTAPGCYHPLCVDQGLPCVSQPTTPDLVSWSALQFIPSLLACKGTGGHRNWFDVTYRGTIFFDEHSTSFLELGYNSDDDDYNFWFHAPVVGGTCYRGGISDRDPDLKLEFDADETIKVDHFQDIAWWKQLADKADGDEDEAHHMVDGHTAVVIGLMGFDGAHDDTTPGSEMHPVHALAVRISREPNPDDDGWAIFVRNWGDEGECSSQQHYLDLSTISLRLPRPGGECVTDTTIPNVKSQDWRYIQDGDTADSPGVPDLCMPNGTCSKLGQDPMLTFHLPAGNKQGMWVGEIHFAWPGRVLAGGVPVTCSPPADDRIDKRWPGDQSVAPAGCPGACGPVGVGLAGAGAGGTQAKEAEDILHDVFAQLTPQQAAVYKVEFAKRFGPKHVTAYSAQAALASTPPPRPTRMPTVSVAPADRKIQRDVAQAYALCLATGGHVPGQPDWCTKVPPVITVPKDVVAEADSPAGASVAYTATAVNPDGSAPSITCTPPSGSVFRLGTTTVSCSATDGHGNTATASFTVTVRDTTPPALAVSLTPSTIWPPNKKLVHVVVKKSAVDLVDPHPTLTCTLACNEPLAAGDMVETPDGDLELLADRLAAGTGRTYSITCTARDAAGNVSPPKTATAIVPHDHAP